MHVRAEMPQGERTTSIRSGIGLFLLLLLLLMSLLAGPGCDEGPASACDATVLTECAVSRHADLVVTAPGDTGLGFFDATRAANDVRGGGDGKGSFDVFSLGYKADNDHIVLAWEGARVLNGPGADFGVFENGFKLSGEGRYFMDLMVVDLSLDGERWVTFPHDYVAEDETRYEKLPQKWVGFAGRYPVRLNVDAESGLVVDPFDPEAAGGDHFDLDALVDSPDDGGAAAEIRAQGFRYIRLRSAASITNPDTGAVYPKDITSDGPDIDGVYGRYVVAE